MPPLSPGCGPAATSGCRTLAPGLGCCPPSRDLENAIPSPTSPCKATHFSKCGWDFISAPVFPWRRPSAQAAGAGLSAQARGLRLEEGDEGDLADLLMQRMLDQPKAVAKAPPAPAVTHS